MINSTTQNAYNKSDKNIHISNTTTTRELVMPEANEYQTIEIEENNLKIFLKIPLSTEDDLDAKTDINNIMIHTLQEQLSGI